MQAIHFGTILALAMTVSMRNKPGDKTGQVLVAVADIAYATALSGFLQASGHTIEFAHDAKGVLRLVGRRQFDVIVLDLGLEAESDVELVSFIREHAPASELVVLFEVSQVDRAIEAVRHGAFFYLPISGRPTDVAHVVDKAQRHRTTKAAVDRFEQSLFEELVGGTPAMKRVIEIVMKVAPTDSTVLLLGESGTGKEVMANAVHRLSRRADKPLVAVNCAALPEGLLESELFGHVKGAFTGAHADKIGLFEEADGGAILLDEIGDMALATQAKLLRVLQNGEIRPVGSSTSSRVDVRVIAATNRDLEEAVAEGRFREDLYFRLNVVQVRIPPLRERVEALPKLANHFLAQFNEEYEKTVRGFDEHAQVLLREYQYPGNVRELESIVAHAVIMSDGDMIRAADLPDNVRSQVPPRLALPNYADEDIPTISEMEARLIQSALEKLDGNQTEVAKRLDISRSTLWRKMKQYGISAYS